MVDEFFLARPVSPRRRGTLTPEQRARIVANVAAAPPPTAEQIARLKQIFEPYLIGLDLPARTVGAAA